MSFGGKKKNDRMSSYPNPKFKQQQREFGSTAGTGAFQKGNQFQRSNNPPHGTGNSSERSSVIQGGDEEDLRETLLFKEARETDEIDSRFGFDRLDGTGEQLGWLLNMCSTIVKDEDWPGGRAAVDYYFLQEDGKRFKATMSVEPYFYILTKENTETDVEQYLRRKFEDTILRIVRVQKEDLNLANHLSGKTRTYLQVIFRNCSDLLKVRRVILPAVLRNQEQQVDTDNYDINDFEETETTKKKTENLSDIVDIREYDIPYYLRVAIDKDVRVGYWYTVRSSNGKTVLDRRTDLLERAEPVVLAFDIECTKAPLKFPDAKTDVIMMISYMVDKQGYLITNRQIVSKDIEDFEYTPKPEFEGPFIVFNEANETELLRRFFEHIREVKPSVFVTFNGDSFDWPFVQERATINGFDLKKEIGFEPNSAGEYLATHAVHMDAYRWVKRDSYLPAGSQGLKAVTAAKLGYSPLELDPEDMTRFAKEKPQTLASYSVSDAVATFYLYSKYVHPFIFSLCNIIPLDPDEVLRKGSGTLCETLLMVQAYLGNIIIPNKQVTAFNKLYEGHLIESETYVGGHVEALEAGVFRADLPVKFRLDTTGYQTLIDGLDSALTFELEVEGKLKMEEVTNYAEVRQSILDKLTYLRDNPNLSESPLIYHLDVAAMYPNIILTNRLQPPSLIDEATCAACDFNVPEATCQRPMKWSWRGQFNPASKNEMEQIRGQLESEKFPNKVPGAPLRSYHDLPVPDQASILQKRLADYSRKVYKKTHITKVEERESMVCMRENSFYVDTVRNFRDRRYVYKDEHKKWKKNSDVSAEKGDVAKLEEAKKMVVLFDSLQLAHKCILNSFYGYVMRKGARWYSMEMAGIVCQTGANIIKMARELVERVGRPLELDTDGIWCILPKSFPENISFQTTNPKKPKFGVSYPCAMLNHLVHAKFTNDQYQELVDPENKVYSQRSENSVFFEVDGPYKAMILPSSKEEDKQLKKRYAVFNNDGSLAELKGFEVKRRGELKIIKVFQTQIFERFLDGDTLEQCYAEVGSICNKWLDILYSKGKDMEVHEVVELLSENRNMSRTLDDYGAQKSTSISTAKRLAEFLGDQMIKDKGLTCQYIISEKPFGTPVTERAIPVAIFSAEESVKKHYIRKWLKDPSLNNFDIRSILDWAYYIERLSSTIQKLVTIPAAMQKVANPVARVRHPEWLFQRVAEKDDTFRQTKINDMFSKARAKKTSDDPAQAEGENPDGEDSDSDRDDQENTSPNKRQVMDMEDIVPNVDKLLQKSANAPRPVVHKRKRGEADKAKHKLLSNELEPLPEVAPDRATDYIGWLEYSKIKWRNLRKEMRVRKTEWNSEEGPARKLFKTGVTSFFQRQARTLAEQPWEILQIVETETPGVFRVWAMVDKNLHSVKLTVPRIFYVNSRVEEANSAGTRAYRTLPRSHPCLFLYRFEMNEVEFLHKSKELTQFWLQPSVEGVYESKVPLLFRALMGLGSVCLLTRKAAKRANDAELHLDDLQVRKAKDSPYLANAGLRYLYLYHSFTGDRHVIGLFDPQLERATAFIVGSQHSQDHMPNIQRMYTEFMAQRKAQNPETLGSDEIFSYPDNLEVTTRHFADSRGAFKAVSQELGKYQSEKRGPTVLVVQSLKNLRAMVPRLSDFPFVLIPANTKDNQYQALDWQRHACRKMLYGFSIINKWLSDQIKFSRYSNIPIGNIESDPVCQAADLFWARSLHSKDMLLWVSTTGTPDLGGKEQDDSSNQIEDWSNPEVNNPGSYKTISIELEIGSLAFNTILCSSATSEIENPQGPNHQIQLNLNLNATSLDDFSSATEAFSTLKQLVQLWTAELVHSQNEYADTLLAQFYRWIKSTSSKLYDPAVHKLVHNMMKRLFLSLLGELKNLGATIVHANFNRIIIGTSKISYNNALAYCTYVIQAINKKPMFREIELNPMRLWNTLLWMDPFNFGGLEGNAPDQPVNEAVHMNWNVGKYLPVALQGPFRTVVAEYIFHTDAAFKSYEATKKPNSGADDTLPEYVVTNRNLVVKNFSQRLFKIVQEVHKNQSNTAEYAFPKLAGSHLDLNNPVLEFIKSLCAVLGLDAQVENEVYILKKNLLSLAGVNEFSSEANFRNPSLSFKMNEVFCQYCNYCQDVDLCRDEHFCNEEKKWTCVECGNEYNKTVLEEELLKIAQGKSIGYLLQDLKCTKCGLVKIDNVPENCSCSGRFVTSQPKPDFLGLVKTFHNLATFHQLPLLEETCVWISGQNGRVV